MQPQREDEYLGGNLYNAGNDLLRQIHIAMIRLDSKMDGLDKRLNDLQKSYSDKYTDQETRIRVLEQRPYVAPATVWRVIGALTGVASVAVGLTALLIR